MISKGEIPFNSLTNERDTRSFFSNVNYPILVIR